MYNNDHDNTLGFGPGKDKEYIETNEGRLIDPKGATDPVPPAAFERQHFERRGGHVEVEVYGILK